MTADCAEMERRLVAAGGKLEDFDPLHSYERYDVAVDALFGIGLNSPLRPDGVKAVECMTRCRWIVSADIPSGLHADSGEMMGCAVKADVTVTFSAAKPGLCTENGRSCCGKLVIADIGIPEDLLARD